MSVNVSGKVVHTLALNTRIVENIETEEHQVHSPLFISQVKNPLEIALVVECILKCLSFKDLQQCRLVNGLFNVTANRLMQSAVCVLKNSQCSCEPTTSSILNLNAINMLPQAFVVRNNWSCFCRWNLQDLTSQISHFSTLMTKLVIDGVFLSRVETIMIARMGSLTTLKIDSNIPFVIPLDELAKIEDLQLASNCSILIPIDIINTCCPKTLSLCNTKFLPMRDCNIVLNDIFNFRRCTHLTLTYNDLFDTCAVILKLWKPLHLEMFDVDGVMLQTEDVITGEVNVLCIEWLHTHENADFKNVDVKVVKTAATVDKLSFIPTNVSCFTLHLVTKRELDLDRFTQYCFPNLKTLKMTCKNPNAFVSTFGKFCKSLETIQFNWHAVNLNHLPPSIKKIMLRDNGKVMCDTIVEVETLVLDMYSLQSAREVMQIICAFNVVLKSSKCLNCTDEVIDFTTNGDLFIGPVTTDYVDKYFVRQENVYTEISKQHFQKMLKA